jgi:integrase
MVKMKKRSDGRWQKSITLPNGKRKVFYSTLPNQRQAEADIMRQAMSFKDKEEKGLLFSKVAELWEEEHCEKLAYSTAAKYKPLIKYANALFSDTLIKDITPNDIKLLISKKIKQGYAAKTITHQLSILKMIFDYACIEGHIKENPCQHIRVPSGLPKQKRRIPLSEEIQKVILSTDKSFGMIAFFALYTGMRKGEILALNWEDIDFENKLITVDKAVYFVGNSPHIKKPKTEAGTRKVILLDCVIEKLDRKKHGLVFPGADGISHMKQSYYEDNWDKYKKETGLNITLHQLRHAYASYILHDAGIDVKTAQELLGHADVSTTQNIYTQITESKLQKTAAQLNTHTSSM